MTNEGERCQRRITTPFGRAKVNPAHIAAHAAVKRTKAGTAVHKWSILHDITTARQKLNLSSQTLVVFEALLTFHPETALLCTEDQELIVFPSNATLSLRARGTSESSLRRHLGALVKTGLVIRCDSPNGKRYARKGDGGIVTQAYGFDLAPLVARSAEIAAMAQEVRSEAAALKVASERVTILRRDCCKLIMALERDDAAIEASGYRDRYTQAVSHLPRKSPRLSPADLNPIGDLLEALAIDVGNTLIARHETSKMDGNAVQTERHKQNSKPYAPDSENAFEPVQKDLVVPNPAAVREAVNSMATRATYSLRSVLESCPEIQGLSADEIRTWRDLVDMAGRACLAMGISVPAWREAKAEMGEETAAITVAAILERVEQINSPGGYLRALVERKRAGLYSIGPVLQALNRSRLVGRRPVAPG